MAKKKPAIVSVIFRTETRSREYPGVIYKRLDSLPQNALRFLHFERKGNTFLLLDGMHTSEDLLVSNTMVFDRFAPKDPQLNVRGEDLDINMYNVLHVEDHLLYYLDELPDGTWRITHTPNVLPFDHDQLVQIAVAGIL